MAPIAVTRAVTAVVPRTRGENAFGGVDEGLAADGLLALAVGAVLENAVADAELVEVGVGRFGVHHEHAVVAAADVRVDQGAFAAGKGKYVGEGRRRRVLYLSS